MSSRSESGKEAVTSFKKILFSQGFSHLEIYPHTGRTHQIRVHLSEAGFPIVGDTLYFGKKLGQRPSHAKEPFKTLVSQATMTFLHAKCLEFVHPFTSQPLVLEAKRPEPFDIFLNTLKESLQP